MHEKNILKFYKPKENLLPHQGKYNLISPVTEQMYDFLFFLNDNHCFIRRIHLFLYSNNINIKIIKIEINIVLLKNDNNIKKNILSLHLHNNCCLQPRLSSHSYIRVTTETLQLFFILVKPKCLVFNI